MILNENDYQLQQPHAPLRWAETAADNFIALYSRFIACRTYEATFILDALLQNPSQLKPNRLHADAHDQSAAVLGLTYLLEIELMPRTRRWQALKLHRSDNTIVTQRSVRFSGSVSMA